MLNDSRRKYVYVFEKLLEDRIINKDSYVEHNQLQDEVSLKFGKSSIDVSELIGQKIHTATFANSKYIFSDEDFGIIQYAHFKSGSLFVNCKLGKEVCNGEDPLKLKIGISYDLDAKKITRRYSKVVKVKNISVFIVKSGNKPVVCNQINFID